MHFYDEEEEQAYREEQTILECIRLSCEREARKRKITLERNVFGKNRKVDYLKMKAIKKREETIFIPILLFNSHYDMKELTNEELGYAFRNPHDLRCFYLEGFKHEKFLKFLKKELGYE